jgi:quaternary ammonium compound-resistance protein SugE
MSSWGILVVAGLLEIVWAIGLKKAEGFTRLGPSVVTVLAMIASMYLLGRAARDLPIGTAYAVWVGIGAAGTALVGMAALGEPITPSRVGFLCLLVVSIVGLKAAA